MMRWWGWWKDEPEEPLPDDSERRRASVTADLDAVIAQVRTEQAAAAHSAQVASRKAVNGARKVIGRTGQWKAMEVPPPKTEEPTS